MFGRKMNNREDSTSTLPFSFVSGPGLGNPPGVARCGTQNAAQRAEVLANLGLVMSPWAGWLPFERR